MYRFFLDSPEDELSIESLRVRSFHAHASIRITRFVRSKWVFWYREVSWVDRFVSQRNDTNEGFIAWRNHVTGVRLPFEVEGELQERANLVQFQKSSHSNFPSKFGERFYLLAGKWAPALMTDNDGVLLAFDSIESAREAAKKCMICQTLGYVILVWDEGLSDVEY